MKASGVIWMVLKNSKMAADAPSCVSKVAS